MKKNPTSCVRRYVHFEVLRGALCVAASRYGKARTKGTCTKIRHFNVKEPPPHVGPGMVSHSDAEAPTSWKSCLEIGPTRRIRLVNRGFGA